MNAPTPPQIITFPPTAASQIELFDGEIWVSGLLQRDGRIKHTILMPGEDKLNWSRGMDWAKDHGGDLPDRIQQALLNHFHRDQFQPRAYWSNTQHAVSRRYAWYQGFDDGYQDYSDKSAELLVRAVRSVTI